MKDLRQKADLRLIGGSFLVAIVFIGLTMSVLGTVVDHWIRYDARIKTAGLARVLADHLPQLPEIVAGHHPQGADARTLQLVQSLSGAARITLAAPDGRPILAMADERSTTGQAGTENIRLPAQGDVPYTRIDTIRQSGKKSIVATTVLPVLQEDRTIAILETRIDETDLAASFRRDLIIASLILASLLGLTFAFGYSWLSSAIRSRNASEERAEFLASHDGLTGLLNRQAFQARLDTMLAKLDTDQCIALHHLDIDHFKRINDDLGEEGADKLIRLVALRLRETVRPSDILARLGGDELVIAQCGITLPEQAEVFSRRLVDRLSEPYSLEGREVRISVSIGCSLAPLHARQAQDLMAKAGIALQFIKSTGHRGSGIFGETMEEELINRRDLGNLVRSALQKDLFNLHFQPIMCLSSGRISGFEALLRLTSEAGAPVSPALFIPAAEELGLLPEIGEWVLKRACQIASGWADGMSVAVNLSPSQFASGELPRQVAAALQASGLAAERLELEITEGILLKDTEAILQQLTGLKALGVTIVMDDFGTGYSSLSYLWRFPFDKLKIDRSFMEAYSHSGETIQQILKAIVALGRALKMQVTIEGIETVFHARAIKDLAIDNLQGYLFGKPMAEAEIPNGMLRDFLKTMNAPADPPAAPRTSLPGEHKTTAAG
jgi:diguanylate cyclase (GGDEF)-like protein